MPPLNPGSWQLGLQPARLTLHDSDPITGNEDLLSSLFYEYYRGYTIYSTSRGRCCIHGKLGCLKLLGRFVCFSTIEDAKNFIQWLRREGYTSADPVERSLPPEAYVWLNWHKSTGSPGYRVPSSPSRRDGNKRGDYHIFPSSEEVEQETMKRRRSVRKSTTPTFLLELPLRVDAGQATRLRAHFEAARCLYNALLGEAMRRLHRMRTDPAWQAARALPLVHKQERKEAFSRLRQTYSFSEYALHEFAKEANCSWIADHIDSIMAQTLATRAYRAANRVCLGHAKNVRFRSKGRGLDSVENKRNNTGMRFLLQPPDKGNQGWLLWRKDLLPTLIDWHDPVVHHGLRHPIKYARIVRRKASSPNAQGADREGYRYYVQLVLEGHPYQKKKHSVGTDAIGLDVGPSTIAIVPLEGEAELLPFCEELKPDARAKRRLQRKLDRQRRANNPENYDEKGRIKKRGKRRLTWKSSKGYLATRRRLAAKERKLAAHRKSLHGRLVHHIIRRGNTIRTEKLSYKAWQKQYGKSVGRNAPGMFLEQLRRTVASTGGILSEFPTYSTRLSQYCHGCGRYVKKPLAQRWHHCPCGIGPVQRDLYSAWLAAHLNLPDTIPSIAHAEWEGADLRLRAAIEVLQQRANEGQALPRSVGIPRAGARLPKSLAPNRQELVYRRGRLEALG